MQLTSLHELYRNFHLEVCVNMVHVNKCMHTYVARTSNRNNYVATEVDKIRIKNGEPYTQVIRYL